MLHLHSLYNYWLCFESEKGKLSVGLFRRMQIQNEKDKNEQIHRSWTRIRVNQSQSLNLTLNCSVFTHSNFVLNHKCLFTDFKQVENLAVILLTLKKSKTQYSFYWLLTNRKVGSYFADYDQVNSYMVAS